MRVLYLPSWWPTRKLPFNGIFFKEQIERIAELNPQHEFTVLYWGHPHLELSPRNFICALKNFFSFRDLPLRPQSHPNLRFITLPLLTLPRRLGGTRLQSLMLRRFLKRKTVHAFDLIHAMVGLPAAIVAQDISTKLQIPYLVTEVMGPFPFPHLRESDGKIWAPLLDAYRSAAITISDGIHKVETMKRDEIGTVGYIPNFVNETFFELKPIPSKTPKFRFFTLAGLVPGKGIDTLIKAIARVPERESCEFVIGGGGELAAELRTLAQSLGVAHLISWIGHVGREEAVTHFQASHAFVLPSRFESFGVVYVEALFCGRPIIATRCGGPQEFVNETTGLICEVDDVEGLAKAMSEMKANIASYSPEEIRQWAFERYSSQVVCEKIIACYGDVLRKKRR